MKPDLRALIIGSTALVAACGSSSGPTTATTRTSSVATLDEASKSADQIFADAVAALRQVPIAHARGVGFSGDPTATVDDVSTQTTGRLTLTEGGRTSMFVLTGGQAYAVLPTGAMKLTGDAATEIQSFTLAAQADCTAKEHGHLTKGSTSTINGHRVIAIMDDGRAPGASVGTAYVSVDAPHLVVRTVTTLESTPGGSLSCGHDQSSATPTPGGQTLDWDYPDSVPLITAPPGA